MEVNLFKLIKIKSRGGVYLFIVSKKNDNSESYNLEKSSKIYNYGCELR